MRSEGLFERKRFLIENSLTVLLILFNGLVLFKWVAGKSHGNFVYLGLT